MSNPQPISILKDSTVAVIGSSPQLLHHPCGQKIDAHDIVMRTNLHGVHGRPEYFGSRTDVRFLFGWHKREDYPDIAQQAECRLLVTRERMRWLSELTGIPAHYTKLKMTNWLEAANPKLLDGLNIRRGHHTWNTTSGSDAIAIALRYGARQVTLYGFTFTPEERWDTIHEDGSVALYDSYDPLPSRAGHAAPEDEVALLLRVMEHYPVVASSQSPDTINHNDIVSDERRC